MAKIKGCIDVGHGGKDCANKGENGYIEADGNLKKAKYLKAELERTGQFEIKLTRDKDMTLELSERGKIAAHFGADFFISEHTNATDSVKKASGTVVFYSVDIPTDKQFAEDLAKAISEALGIPNRGAKTRESEKNKGEDYYTVIDVAQDLGVKHCFIVEDAFHDNPEEEALLLIDENLKKIAIAKAKVVCKFYGVQYIPETQPTTKQGMVTATSLNVRESFSTTAKIVKTINKDTKVIIFEEKDGWYRIGENQWVSGKYVKLADDNVVETTPMPSNYIYKDCKVVEVNPLDLKIIVADKPANTVGAKNMCTSIFQTWDAIFENGKKTSKLKSVPLGILVSDGKIISNRQPHVGFGNIKYPAGTLIIHNDGKVEFKSIVNIDNEKNVKFATSGVSILPKIRMNEEGFCKRKSVDGIVRDFSDVGRTTSRICIGYNSKKNKVVIVGMISANIGKAQTIMKELGCDVAISCDAGGSAIMVVDGRAFMNTTRQLFGFISW